MDGKRDRTTASHPAGRRQDGQIQNALRLWQGHTRTGYSSDSPGSGAGKGGSLVPLPWLCVKVGVGEPSSGHVIHWTTFCRWQSGEELCIVNGLGMKAKLFGAAVLIVIAGLGILSWLGYQLFTTGFSAKTEP